MPCAIREDDKRKGVTPPHIKIRHDAMRLAAGLRPAGSVNLSRLKASRSVEDRQMAVQEERLLSKLDAYLCDTLENLGKLYLGEAPESGKPHLAIPVGEDLAFLAILKVWPNLIKPGPGAPRIMVETEKGNALLPPETKVVWR